MWFVFALGSAVFAALTSILAKIGIEGVNSTLATAIRTAVVLAMSWGMVFLTGTQGGVKDIGPRSWLFLILSGLATGASLAVLLLRFADRGCVQGGAGGQAERGHHPGAGLFDPARARHLQKPDRLRADRGGHPVHGLINETSAPADSRADVRLSKKSRPADMCGWDGTHTGKLSAESVRGRKAECAVQRSILSPGGYQGEGISVPAHAGRNGFPLEHIKRGSLVQAVAADQSRVYRARVALRTASTITPTSAKMPATCPPGPERPGPGRPP